VLGPLTIRLGGRTPGSAPPDGHHHRPSLALPRRGLFLPLAANNNEAESSQQPSKKKKSRRKKKKTPNVNDLTRADSTQMSKEELIEAVGESMAQAKNSEKGSLGEAEEDESLLDKLNPFKAGQNLRKTIDTALTSIAAPPTTRDSLYWIDDRLSLGGGDVGTESGWDEDYVPEVLVVGALGSVGQLVVQRLLRGNAAAGRAQFRVRVLVPDLYTDTLERFGTGVTYSQGDLSNVDSLEYAVTDVDKIVMCPTSTSSSTSKDDDSIGNEDVVLKRLQERAQRAEQYDCWGMKNLVQAYQHVRHADYGTSQAAKRTLFKFSRPEDFNLFAIDYNDDEEEGEEEDSDDLSMSNDKSGDFYDDYEKYEYTEEDDEYEYEDDYDNYDDDVGNINNGDSTTTSQVQWIRNKFQHAVFVGRMPSVAQENIVAGGAGSQAAIVSSRLRSRENPDLGIDLSTAFAGLILRVCSDGGTYEAFVRTTQAEYACPFSTDAKFFTSSNNKSKNKFTTVRLPFDKFQPVLTEESNASEIPAFRGQDVQQIGFRYRAASNQNKNDNNPLVTQFQKQQQQENSLQSFYLAFSYMKLYRSQPEPEFVYVSDARIPPIVSSDMVRHDMKRLLVTANNDGSGSGEEKNVLGGGTGGGAVLLDDRTIATSLRNTVSTEEEVYYKYLGEETLKKSGLAYAVVRVQEYKEEEQDSALTEIELAAEMQTEDDKSRTVVTQDQVAQVCVSALLDAGALNKSFYLQSKQASPTNTNDLKSQFGSLPKDPVALP